MEKQSQQASPEALQLAQIQANNDFNLSPAGQEIQVIRARSDASFALTPVGQELKRFETNMRMGQMFAQSTLVPEAYRGNLSNCAIAIDMAMRMNANPLMVMQNLYIVHGTPSWSSKFLVATINSCGRFKPLKYRFFEDGTIGKHDYWESVYNPETKRKENVKKTFDGSRIKNLCCVAYTSETDSDEILESSVISCRLAVQEGWWTKNQSKWPTMTQQMLMYRAAAFWQRTYAPEISMGFMTDDEARDTAEDVSYVDMATGEVNEIPAAAPAKKKRSLKDIAAEAAMNATQEAAPEVTAEEVTAAPQENEPDQASPETGLFQSEQPTPKAPAPEQDVPDWVKEREAVKAKMAEFTKR